MNTIVSAAKRWKWVLLAVVGAILVVWPLVYHDEYNKSIAIRIIIYILLASSLNIINGFTGQFILGQAGLICVGAYTAALLATRSEVPFFCCLLAAGVVAAMVGFVICLPTFKLSGIYLSIVTVGFAESIRLICLNWNSFTGGPMGVKSIPSPDFLGIPLTSTNSFYYIALVLTVMTIFVVYRTFHSRIGRAWSSLKEDQLAASSLGVELAKYKALSFVMGAFFSGLGGALIAYFYRYIASDMFMMDESFNIISMMIVGGSGTIGGPILGAVIVCLIKEVFRFADSYRTLMYAVIVIAMMWWRPQGLLGGRNSDGLPVWMRVFQARKKSREKERE